MWRCVPAAKPGATPPRLWDRRSRPACKGWSQEGGLHNGPLRGALLAGRLLAEGGISRAVVNPRQVAEIVPRPPADRQDGHPATPRSWPTSPRWSVQPSAPRRWTRRARSCRPLLAPPDRREAEAEGNRREGSARPCVGESSPTSSGLERNLKETDGDLPDDPGEPLWRRRTLSPRAPLSGTRCEHHLLANLPEVGSLNRKQIAALVGGSPSNGGTCGASARFGRTGPSTDHVSTWRPVAARHDPLIRSFYQRLGVAKKLALTACMRKLLRFSMPCSNIEPLA